MASPHSRLNAQSSKFNDKVNTNESEKISNGEEYFRESSSWPYIRGQSLVDGQDGRVSCLKPEKSSMPN